MKKMRKKMIAMLLAVIMIGGTAPLGALAETDWLTIRASAETYSGSCGENVTWSLDTQAGILTISGTGYMYCYHNYNTPGWYAHRSLIQTVTIDSGVTSIGDYAFSNCTSLASVTISNSVTSIAIDALWGCTSLETFTVDADNTAFSSDADGVLYNKDKTALLRYPAGNPRTSFTIPDSVTTIGDSAFSNCTSLASVTIPNSVTYIDKSAFSYCTSLVSVTIPNSVTYIGKSAFSYCTSLVSVTIPNSVTSIGDSAFFYCTSLVSVTIPNSVTSIGDYAFYGCGHITAFTVSESNANYSVDANGVLFNKDKTNLLYYPAGCLTTTYTIPDSVTSVYSYAFKNCTNLVRLTIGKSLSLFYGEVFSDLTNVASFTVDTDNANLCSDADGVLYNKDKTALLRYPAGNPRTSFTIPDSVTTIDDSAFSHCTSLVSVTIPDSVTRIGLYGPVFGSTFYECTSLTNVTIGNGITSLTPNDFSGCPLEHVRIGSGFSRIPSTLINRSCLKSFVIGSGITEIGSETFSGCTNLESVTIPDGMTRIGDSAFSDCTALESVTIPDSVTDIGAAAFSGCTGLSVVTIGSGVTSIGDAAFAFCKSLGSVTIPSCVETVGDDAFLCCTNLADVTILDGVTYIGNSAFYACSGITSITIPGSVSYIKDFTFEKCTNIVRVTIENGVTEIGENAFNCCSRLQNVTIGNSLESIGSMAFSNCLSLTDITIPDTVTRIDEYAFAGVCNIDYHGSASGSPWGARCVNGYVDGYLVYDSAEKQTLCACSALTVGDVRLPDGLSRIGDRAFAGCTKMTGVTLPDSVTSIGDHAFSWCTSLESVTIPDSVTSIGDSAFYGCACLAALTVGVRVTYIGKDAFYMHLDERLFFVLAQHYDEWIRDGVTQYEGIPLDAVRRLLDHPNGSLTDVYYNGIQPLWDAIETEDGNDDLLNAVIHCVGTAPMVIASDAAVGCSAGRLVRVTVDLKNNPGLIATRLHIGYDTQQLRLVQVSNGEVFDNSIATFGNDLTAEPYTLLWSDDTAQIDNTANGTLFVLTFEVQDTACTGDSEITIAIDEDSTFNTLLQMTKLYTVSGTVHIVDCTPGDASGEGKVSLLDSVMISRYLAEGWNVTINEINADVNGDGYADLKDVVLIRRFLAGGWNVTLK